MNLIRVIAFLIALPAVAGIAAFFVSLLLATVRKRRGESVDYKKITEDLFPWFCVVLALAVPVVFCFLRGASPSAFSHLVARLGGKGAVIADMVVPPVVALICLLESWISWLNEPVPAAESAGPGEDPAALPPADSESVSEPF